MQSMQLLVGRNWASIHTDSCYEILQECLKANVEEWETTVAGREFPGTGRQFRGKRKRSSEITLYDF